MLWKKVLREPGEEIPNPGEGRGLSGGEWQSVAWCPKGKGVCWAKKALVVEKGIPSGGCTTMNSGGYEKVWQLRRIASSSCDQTGWTDVQASGQRLVSKRHQLNKCSLLLLIAHTLHSPPSCQRWGHLFSHVDLSPLKKQISYFPYLQGWNTAGFLAFGQRMTGKYGHVGKWVGP